MEEGADRIYILGGTGTRLDHVVANQTSFPCSSGKKNAFLWMRTTGSADRSAVDDRKSKQYGKYVSLFAFGGQVKGAIPSGFFIR